MSDPANDARDAAVEGISAAPTRKSLWQRTRGPALFAVFSLGVIWAVLPRVPASWGIRFGHPYLVFFSLAVLGATLLFVLLNWGPSRRPDTRLMTCASILLVYVATVGGLTAFGLWYYPQFDIPKAAAEKDATEGRGKAVFLSPTFACFACHSIETLGIRGGTRGPDLSDAGKRAGARRAGTSAEDYLRESIVNPGGCFTPLPGSGLVECQPAADPAGTYPQLMPQGFKDRLSEEQLDDLVAFLMTLKGTAERNGKAR